MHLYCISEIIPIFHAAGHLAYARSTRRYLDCMKELPNLLGPNEFQKLTEKGYFTIRRSDRFWSGNFTDQTIEQVLMRMLKTQGGLAHGRGLTPNTQAKFVQVLPKCVPICNALETFCNVHSDRSDQHRDLREASTTRDAEHLSKLFAWLSSHSPFSFISENKLVSIGTGIVADESADADNAPDIGMTLAKRQTGKMYGDMKLKRKDRIIPISAAHNTTNVNGKEIEINSTLLFMRVTCIIKQEKEMKEYLQYEFATYPPSIFYQGVMRKNNKSDLANILKKLTEPTSIPPEGACYVVDGGYLLHTVVWPQDGTYKDVCHSYIQYVTSHFGTSATVIFDGYGDHTSTKRAEQSRRTKKNTSPKNCF